MLDELDRQSQQKEVRIILENIKQRQREASAKALGQKTVWKCPPRTLPHSATAFNMALVLRRETNKAAALEKRRLSVEREKLATKKAEEEPKSMKRKKQSSRVGEETVVSKVDSIPPKKKMRLSVKREKLATKKAEEEPKSMEIKKQSSSVGAKTVVSKVDSISPKKKIQRKRKCQPCMEKGKKQNKLSV